MEYQLLDASGEGIVGEYDHMDQLWNYQAHLKRDSGLKFNLQFEVLKYVLALPHSNAEEGHVFSKVAKNKTNT